MNQKKVLIVEDDQSIAGILKRNLDKENFDVTIAADGKEGLQKALAIQPDLILLDIIMPKMDGITMLKKLRQNPKGKNIQVMILTNLTKDSDRLLEVANFDAADFLVKANWSIKDLIGKVKKTLNT